MGEVCWLNVLDGHSHFSVRNHRSHCESKPKPPQKPTHSLRQSVEYIHTESTGEDHIETHREEHEFIDQ